MGLKLRITVLSLMVFCLWAGAAHGLVLKVATLSPEGSFWMERMREGAAEVKEKTEGRVKFKFYPGGVMGTDKAVLRKIRIGQLQGGAFTSGSVAAFYPDSQVYTLPLKFRSLAEVDYVRERMDPLIMAGLEEGGFVTFGLAEGGFAYIMSASPVRTVADLKKQKVWVPDNDSTALEAVKAFGIKPIPLSIADVRTGLSTGLINSVAIAPIGAIVLQWHTQVKYLTDLPLVYIYALMAVDKKKFARIKEADQTIVREVMGRAFREIDRKNRNDNVKSLSVLKEQGIEFLSPAEGDLAEWHQRSAGVPERLTASGRLTGEMVERLNAYITEFRNKEGKGDE